MATRLKPTRINVDNTPRVWDGAAYQNDNDFHWSMGGWDMSYEDFEWVTLTWNSLVIENISNNVTPTGNFTVSAGTLKPGIEYVLRVNTGNTAYTMTLGTGVTNPNGYSTELTPNKVNQFKFIATSNSQLELEWVDTSEYLTWLTILSYGNSTWNDFITAYNKNAIVYCRASSNSNPATWAQNRLAFMAYVNNASSPTEVEFQYYRSRSSHGSDANQQDEVYVYKLTNTSWWTWTVEVRDTAAKIATWTWLTKAYTTSWSKSTLTIANDGVLTVNGANGTVIVNDIKQSATAPANPTAWTAWYDTTNGVLKVYNGTAWDNIATGWAISDTAYWPGWNGQTTTAPSQNAVYDKISSIDALIPSEATSSNKLADKAFVGDSINSVTAYYITKNANWDQFATKAELDAATTFYSGGQVRVPTMNDYTIVLDDETHDHATTRYIYNNGWEYQYTVNETALTQAQLNALNSGITAWKVSTYDWYATGKQDTLVSGTNIKTVNNQSLLWSGDISINWILSGPLVPAASSQYAGKIWFDTTNNIFWKCDWTSWEAIETNTKTFYLWGLSDNTTAQAAYDRYLAGKYPIIELLWGTFMDWYMDWNSFILKRISGEVSKGDTTTYSTINKESLYITISSWSVTEMHTIRQWWGVRYLDTNQDYSTPYTPQYNGSPATKKYVDDHWVPSGWNNGDVLTNVSWTPTWSAPSGWDVMVSSQSWNILTSWMKIWAWTEADYWNLGTYDSNTLYLTV